MENNHLLNSNKEKENEIKKLYNEKTNLSNKLSYKELECQQLINQINVLNDLLKNHQDELENNLKENYKIKKETLLKEKLNEESYKKEIEDLQSKLKGNINFEKIEEIISDKEKNCIIFLIVKIPEIQDLEEEEDLVLEEGLIEVLIEDLDLEDFLEVIEVVLEEEVI